MREEQREIIWQLNVFSAKPRHFIFLPFVVITEHLMHIGRKHKDQPDQFIPIGNLCWHSPLRLLNYLGDSTSKNISRKHAQLKWNGE
jgi:hypothetical protein